MPRALMRRLMWAWLPPTGLMPNLRTTSATLVEHATNSRSLSSVWRTDRSAKCVMSTPASDIFLRR